MREISQVYLHIFLWNIGGRIAGTFVPAYMLSVGFSLGEVLAYIPVWAIMLGTLSPLVAELQARIKVKTTIAVSVLVQVLFFLMVYTVPSMHWPPALLGAVNGIYSALYWGPRLSLFSHHVDKGKEGQQSGTAYIMVTAADLVGPLILALMLDKTGFGPVSAVGIAFVLFSLVPLFLTRDFPLKMRKPWKRIYERRNLKYYLLYVQDGLINYVITYWPLFIYLTNQNFLAVGGSVILIQLGILAYTAAVGRITDKFSRITTAAVGSILIGLLFGVVAAFPSNPAVVLAASILVGFVSRSWSVPVNAITVSQSNKQDVSKIWAFRETGLVVGREIASIPSMLAASIPLGFGITAAGSILFGLAELVKGRKWFDEA